jgi:tetraacyldisaccharide 4'-kinase
VRDPAFWWRKAGLASALLAPVGVVYGGIAASRMARPGASAGVPVICIGNFTLGGSGKTPAVLAIARMLQAAGERVFCLSRGYGGSLKGPQQVDPHVDHAGQVGDEALLLAHVAPTIVSRNRVTGAKAARDAGATIVLMDDGLQNPSLAKDVSIAVVDGRRGVGNGKIFPAGPLRAPLDAQLSRTEALLVVGAVSGAAGVIAAARSKPVLHATFAADQAAVRALAGKRVLAFAGIGDPEKFFATVAQAGIDTAKRIAFADHHCFSAEEAASLVAERTRVLPVTLEIAELDVLKALLAKAR